MVHSQILMKKSDFVLRLAELLDISPTGADLVAMHPSISHIAWVKITTIVTATAVLQASFVPEDISKLISSVNANKVLAGEILSHGKLSQDTSHRVRLYFRWESKPAISRCPKGVR